LEGYYITIPKPKRKAIPYMGFLANTMDSWKGIALPKQNYKECNTLMKVICKHYGLNYFGPCYWRGIAYAYDYTMHVQYLS
jgi:hypothetical protein